MKKVTNALVVVIFAALAITNNVYAQNTNSNPLMEAAINSSNEPSLNSSANKVSREDINQKAIRHFEKKFKTARNAQWTTLKDGFMAWFIDNDITERVFYNTKGSLFGTLKGYNGDKLSEEIRRIVKANYNGYAITQVEEAQVTDLPGVTAYVVHLEGIEDLKVVRVCDGEIDVMFDARKTE